jgi:hypothetical protein
MVLTLNNLAEKYKCLPSEALEKATTLDLYVLDVSTKWIKYQHDLAEGKVQDNYGLSPDDMKAMIDRVRSGDE